MKTRIASLCLAMVLVLCSCGADRSPAPTNNTIASTHTTTLTASNGVSVSTTNEPVNNTTTIGTSTPVTTGDTSNSETTPVTTTTTMSSIPSATETTIIPTTSATVADTVTFKATVRDNVHNKPVSGVTVTVYINGGASPVGSGMTDQSGVARISLHKGNSYRVVLSTLPMGYEADSEYRFASTTVNITIRKAAVRNELDHSEAQYDVGKTMTDFSLTDTDGKTYRLSHLLKEKKLVILNFWFTSCEPCKMEFPFFEAATQKYNDDVALLAVDPFDSIASMVAIRNQLKVTFPMLQDTCKLYQGFDVTAYPTTVFIDSSGLILSIHTGSFPSEAAFVAAIERYLNYM